MGIYSFRNRKKRTTPETKDVRSPKTATNKTKSKVKKETPPTE